MPVSVDVLYKVRPCYYCWTTSYFIEKLVCQKLIIESTTQHTMWRCGGGKAVAPLFQKQ